MPIPPFTLQPDQVILITFNIDLNQLPPDHYTGTITYVLDTADSPATVPVDVSVRNGPSWPILILILGILLGQISSQLYSKTSVAQNNLRMRANDLSTQILQINNSLAQNDASTKLGAIKNQIYTTSDDGLTKLGNSLDNIDKRIQFYINLDGLEELVKNKVPINDPQCEVLVKEIGDARLSMEKTDVDGDMSDAAQKQKTSHDDIDTWLNQHSDQQAIATFGLLKSGLLSPNPVPPNHQGPKAAKPNFPPFSFSWSFFKGFFIWLWSKITDFWQRIRGTQAQHAELRDVWVRPLMKWLLVIVLALIGLQTFYLSAATFSAGGLTDYFPLFLWGFGANVVGSTFLTLPSLPGGGN